jgi:hypothetical protein
MNASEYRALKDAHDEIAESQGDPEDCEYRQTNYQNDYLLSRDNRLA